MRLYVPTVGSGLRLTVDWTFDVVCERRNSDIGVLVEKSEVEMSDWHNSGAVIGQATIQAGTLLIIDRVYVRAGDCGEYNSLTFRTGNAVGALKKGARFFARVDDCNKIEADVLTHEEVSTVTNKRRKTSLTQSQLRTRERDFRNLMLDNPSVLRQVVDTNNLDEPLRRYARQFLMNSAPSGSIFDGIFSTFPGKQSRKEYMEELEVLVTTDRIWSSILDRDRFSWGSLDNPTCRWISAVTISSFIVPSFWGKYVSTNEPDVFTQSAELCFGFPGGACHVPCTVTFTGPDHDSPGSVRVIDFPGIADTDGIPIRLRNA